MPFSIPYGTAKEPYWGKPTCILNFCEEDYLFSPYIGELVNSCSSLIFLYLTYVGLNTTLRNCHDLIFTLIFLSYGVVGIGSVLFHALLTYPMQLLDELSMIYTACFLEFATYGHNRSEMVQWALGVGLVGVGAGITAAYAYLRNPVFHQLAYALLTITAVGRSLWVQENVISKDKPLASTKSLWMRKRGPRTLDTPLDPRNQREGNLAVELGSSVAGLRRLVSWGAGLFIGAFVIWNCDNVFCDQLREFRREYMGWPWGMLLEGHALWHFGTSVGGYYLILWGMYVRVCLQDNQDKYILYWPHWYILPRILLLDPSSMPMPSKKQLAASSNALAKTPRTRKDPAHSTTAPKLTEMLDSITGPPKVDQTMSPPPVPNKFIKPARKPRKSTSYLENGATPRRSSRRAGSVMTDTSSAAEESQTDGEMGGVRARVLRSRVVSSREGSVVD